MIIGAPGEVLGGDQLEAAALAILFLADDGEQLGVVLLQGHLIGTSNKSFRRALC